MGYVENRRPPWWSFALICGAGLTLGALTSFGQTWLPFNLSPLANSAGTWVAVAFGLCLPNRAPRRGVVFGTVALASMLGGYVIVSELREFPTSSSMILFWTAAAVVVGPVLGIGAAWANSTSELQAGLAFSPLIGVLLGEGIHGLTAIADTTPAVYWICQILVALGLALVIAVVKLSTLRRVAYLVTGSGIVAGMMTLAIARL